MQKFDGAKSRALSLSQIRQIAGRAGRAKGLYQNGTVTTFILFLLLFDTEYKVIFKIFLLIPIK